MLIWLAKGATAVVTALALCVPHQAGAQDTHDDTLQTPGLDIELNAAVTQEQGCLFSFLVQNGHPKDLDEVVFEAVLFDAKGQVRELTLFSFGALPAARPRVRQFVVPGAACNDIGRILFNGVSQCTRQGANTGDCMNGLSLRSRIDTLEVLG